ncbi:hypothetical protein [Pigmentibacter ruber]|uniref:hypothetical protein n=1 Tax=Pigmentibacter ruber TaxID=2683196 RepID=UPI00131B2918|nr:hypothetical protein [Pigmentibacter ruber]
MGLRYKILSDSSSVTIESCNDFTSEDEVTKYFLQFTICEFKGSLYFYDFKNEFLEYISNVRKNLTTNFFNLSYKNFEEILLIKMELNNSNKVICSGYIRSEIDNNISLKYELILDLGSIIVEYN